MKETWVYTHGKTHNVYENEEIMCNLLLFQFKDPIMWS